MRAYIIDDEYSAIQALSGMLTEYCPDIQLIGNARSIPEAVKALKVLQPELVFLDIQMPPLGTAFDLLEQIPDYQFGVIFTTAHADYAVEAIRRVQPWGYLVKPIRIRELQDAVQVAREKLRERTAHRSLVIPDQRLGNQVVRINDILYCKADGSTTDIVYQTAGKTIRLKASRTLKKLELDLPAEQFCRAHHSYIVNLAKVSRYVPTGRNGLVYMSREESIPVSVAKKEAFEKHLRKFVS